MGDKEGKEVLKLGSWEDGKEERNGEMASRWNNRLRVIFGKFRGDVLL